MESREQVHCPGRSDLDKRVVEYLLCHLGFSLTWISIFLELYYDRGNHHEFVSLVKDLARPGEFTQSQTFDFEFTHVEKPYESYTGQNVKLRSALKKSSGAADDMGRGASLLFCFLVAILWFPAYFIPLDIPHSLFLKCWPSSAVHELN
ncbi:hypothetical protein EK904_013080 [Melospiza melodia maxima]|nr:hypothetical protein EK904_013080 [Melospiza melodia maxima]